MTQCTESCSEFIGCPLAPFRAGAERTDESLMASKGSNVPWYVVIGWTLFAVIYVTYQLIYLLPDLKTWLAVAS